MIQGTNVGRGIIDLTVRGDGINEDITRDVDRAGEGVDEAGRRHGEGYGDNFSHGFLERMRATMNEGDHDWEDFWRRATEGSGRSGDESGRDFLRNFNDGVRRGDDGHGLDNVLRRLESAARQSGERGGLDFSEHFLNRLEARMGGDGNLGRLFNRLMDDAVSGNGPGGGSGGDDRRGKTLGERIGRILGAGSRSNVLNVFGKSIGGLVGIVDKVRTGAVGMFGTFIKGFGEAGEGASFFGKILSGLGGVGGEAGGGLSKAFASIASSGPGAAVAIGVVLVSLSAMASIVGSLIALLTAMAATITSALVGALAVLGGALVAVVAAGGMLTAAFMSMTDAQKNLLKDAFRPLREEMVGIGQTMITQMIPAFKTWSANLQDALYLFAPLAQTMGSAFAIAGDALTKSFSGPGFQALAQSLGVYLPNIVYSLTAALGGFLNGLAGLFAAIMPYVLQFAQYLAGVATTFGDWASSAEGQNSIADFVNRALIALQALWFAVTQIGGLIGDVLFGNDAQVAGLTIFDSIGLTVMRMRDAIAQAAADGSLQKWFQDAITFGASLWSVITGLYEVFLALYNSGVLNAIAYGFEVWGASMTLVAPALSYMIDLIGNSGPNAMRIFALSLDTLRAVAISSFQVIISSLGFVGRALDKIGIKNSFSSMQGDWTKAANSWRQVGGVAAQVIATSGTAARVASNAFSAIAGQFNRIMNVNPFGGANFSLPKSSLIGLGKNALAQTNIPQVKMPSMGNIGGGGGPAQYNNPYKDYANSLIKSGPSVATQMKNAIATLNKAVSDAMKTIGTAETATAARTAISSLMKTFSDQSKTIIDAAQQGINTAAGNLAGASSAADARKALAQLRKAQADMNIALRTARRIKAINEALAAQRIVVPQRVDKLVAGLIAKNATLADYAKARERVAASIKDANTKLTAAIALRDDFAKAVTDSVKSYAALTTATANGLNGVAGVLSADDITTNLQERLEKIKAFQTNLEVLRAQGLGDSAYKAIVNAGVDGGSAYAQALIDGGIGSVATVNSLTSQVDNIAAALGTETSNSMYQAGVNAAQGLLDGLNSLEKKIEAAGTRLGDKIAAAIRRTLGINSPSRVLIADMDYVGDGAVIGLDNQHGKVDAAATRLASLISVSPEVAAYASRNGQSPVSGNDESGPAFRDLIVNTPTEDPEAVAREVLNEMTGRL